MTLHRAASAMHDLVDWHQPEGELCNACDQHWPCDDIRFLAGNLNIEPEDLRRTGQA